MNEAPHDASCDARVTLVSSGRHAGDGDLDDLRAGLRSVPRSIPSKHFYDATGSALFERICELPEYYQTRTERALLEDNADRIVAATGAMELVEIGSGAATKTRILLSAMDARGLADMYVPLDVDEEMLVRVGRELCGEFPGLRVHAVGGDFATSLAHVPPGANRLFIFLGGTIGNLRPSDEAPALLRKIADHMGPDDHLLLGTDRIKDVRRLESAYNDSEGVTAAFNRNILEVVNRRAGGDFDPAAYRHRAFYDREERWIEMRLAAQGEQRVRLSTLDLDLTIADGEEIRTEISAKYDRERVEELLGKADLELVDWITDQDDLFALTLARLPDGSANPSGGRGRHRSPASRKDESFSYHGPRQVAFRQARQTARLGPPGPHARLDSFFNISAGLVA